MALADAGIDRVQVSPFADASFALPSSTCFDVEQTMIRELEGSQRLAAA